MKKISTNKSRIVVIVSILGLFWGISACNQSTLPETIEENQNVQSETTETLSIKKEPVEKKYSFVDASNVEYTLIISGRKARLEEKGGHTYYGSCGLYDTGQHEWVEVDFAEPYPSISYAYGCGYTRLYIPTSFSYVYKDYDAFCAESPNVRLHLTRIE